MRVVAIAVLAVLALLTACSNHSSVVVRSPTTSLSTAATPSTSAVDSTGPSKPSITVTPSTGLQDRQIVHVDGAGFTAGEALEVIECAQHGTSTGAGDCNLAGMTPTTADAAGRVTARLTVLRGPFGNNIVCTKQQPCLVSVTQASLTPSEEADAAIDFAPAK